MHSLIKLLVLALFCLGGAASAFAIPTVSISSSGNGVFVLHASGLRSVGGVDLILNYDTATLVNPRVNKGPLTSGATMAVNTGVPGRINMPMANVSGFADSGVIATISFDLIGTPPGIIPSLQTRMVDLGSVPVRSRVINPYSTAQAMDSSAGSTPSGDTPAQADTAAGTETTSAASDRSSRSTTSGSGAVPLLSDAAPSTPAAEPIAAGEAAAEVPQETAREIGEAPASDAPGSGPGTTEPPALAKTASDDDAVQPLERPVREETMPAPIGYQSVLEQVRALPGPRSAKALTELFAGHTTPGVRQEPAIGLTDGSSKLRLLVAPHSAGSKAPNFSLSGAKLLALKPEPDGSWLVEVLPAQGGYSATLTILQGDAETVVPLLVAPPLAGGAEAKLTESGFTQFLSERGTDNSPRFDLNGDGRRDYVDDYIFTANYLARKGSAAQQNDGGKALSVGGRAGISGKGAGKGK